MASLSDRDKGLIQNKITELNSSNTQLQDNIVSNFKDINNLMLFDISSKKFVDEKHVQIYSLEEERRLLTKKTIISPVQEDAFKISTLEHDTFLTINNGRFIVNKNDIPIIDLSIIPSRSYILSKKSGPNFEIWTRDRHGSTTSQMNVPDSYTIHLGNRKLIVKIDNVEKELIVIDDDTLSEESSYITLDAISLASQIKDALDLAGFTDAECLYNQSIKTFTIASGTVGPNSSAEVIYSTNVDDLSNLMKFNVNQVKVPGKFANNKLKIKIDNVEAQIELLFDLRIPVSSSLGFAIDDYSSDWRQDFNGYSITPAVDNNGSTIASILQSAIRSVNSGGYTNAECLYYSSSQKFVIYSGTFGETSSVELLPNDDLNRDIRFLIGMDLPTDSKFNETSYTTLQMLYNYLNSKTIIKCIDLNNASCNCYSLLTMNNVPIFNFNLQLKTTIEYDNASLSQLKLYGNKLRIDSTNNKIDLSDDIVIEKTIPNGIYSESELSQVLQDVLSQGSINEFSVQYKSKDSKFYITAKTIVSFLFSSGTNRKSSIATCIGFSNFVDISNTIFVGNVISFSGVDFYSMTLLPQFVPFPYLNNEPPYYIDDSLINESSALNRELLILQNENINLNLLKSQTEVFNEVYLSSWQSISSYEYQFVLDSISIICKQLSIHSLYSTTDAEYLNLIFQYNSAISNLDSLLSLTANRSIMNLQNFETYITSSEFTEGGSQPLTFSFSNFNNEKFYYTYDNFDVRYVSLQYLPVKFENPMYSNFVTFTLQHAIAFLIKTDMIEFIDEFNVTHTVDNVMLTVTNTYLSTTVIWDTGSQQDLFYDFSIFTNVKSIVDDILVNHLNYTIELKNELWSKIKEKYVVFNNDQFSIKIGLNPVYTKTIVCSQGRSISQIAPAIVANESDTLILSINSETNKQITFYKSTSTGAETAKMIQDLVRLLSSDDVENQPAYTNFACIYDGGLYYLYSGTSGTDSLVNVIGGSLMLPLKLGTNEISGTGEFSNNYFVTIAEIISMFVFSNVLVENESDYIKFVSNDRIEIIQTSLSSRLGFSTILISDAINDLQLVPSSSLQTTYETIFMAFAEIDKGYQNNNISMTLFTKNDVLINNRLLVVNNRINDILLRLSQLPNRILEVNSLLTPALYNSRWNEVVKRLNKKTGSYFKVGEKQLETSNIQQLIIENNTKIAELQQMLS